jgi:hypothetical protein
MMLVVSAAASELLNSNAVASEPQNNDFPTSVCDTLIGSDSIVVIQTVCAPICSSCARVYNKEWQFLGNLTPPIKTAFPEAYIEDGKLLWRDNDTFDYTPAP